MREYNFFQKFKLRPLTSNDLDLLLIWRNQDQIRKYMYTDHIISEVEHHNWYKKISNDETYKGFIFEKNSQPIGFVNVCNMSEKHKHCFWGFYVGEESIKPGMGFLMEYCALTYMFDVLQMHKVNCEILEFNKRVKKLHERFGFEQEGYFKDFVRKEGRFINVIRLSLLRDIWQNNKKAHQEKIKSFLQ